MATIPSASAQSGPTLTITPTSGTPALTDPFIFGQLHHVYQQATNVTVTGTGFPAGQDDITIGLTISTTTATSTTTTTGAVCLVRQGAGEPADCVSSDGNPGYNTVTTDANGNFVAQFQVPFSNDNNNFEAGTYTVGATWSDSTGTHLVTAAQQFTINAAAAVVNEGSQLPSGTYNNIVDVLAAGFQAGESLTIIPTTNFLFNAPWVTNSSANSISEINVGTPDGSTAFYGAGSTANYGGSGLPYASDTDTGCTIGAAGCNAAYLGNHAGGAVAVSVLGSESGFTATTTFTLNPSLEFVDDGVTSFSLPASTQTATFVGHDFPKSLTIPGNSLTLQSTSGGSSVQTIHGTVTTDANGNIPATQFTWTTTLPFGQLEATLDGITFDWANANIVPTPTLLTAQVLYPTVPRGALLASGTTGTPSLVFTQFDSPTHQVSDKWYIFVVGPQTNVGTDTASSITYTTSEKVNGVTETFTYTGTTPTDASNCYKSYINTVTSASEGTGTFNLCGAATNDANGAYMFFTKVPNSFGGSSTGNLELTADGVTATLSPLNIAPKFTLNEVSNGDFTYTSWTTMNDGTQAPALHYNDFDATTNFTKLVNVYPSTATTTYTLDCGCGATTAGATVFQPYPAYTITGLNESDSTLGAYVGSTLWQTFTGVTYTLPGIPVMSVDSTHHGLPPIPDVPGGSSVAWINGSTSANSAEATGLTVLPVFGANSLSASGTILPGNVVSMLSVAAAPGKGGVAARGIHGLAANTQYTVTLGGKTATTFTSTAQGDVPAGLEFTVPPSTSGILAVDFINSAGVSAIFGQIRDISLPTDSNNTDQFSTQSTDAAATVTASAEFSAAVCQLPPTGGIFTNTCLSVDSVSEYNHMAVSISSVLTITPSLGNVNSTVSLSGPGLGASTTYYTFLPIPDTTPQAYASYSSFTTDANGNIPSTGTSFNWPIMPTSNTLCNNATLAEQGLTKTVFIAAKQTDINNNVNPSAPVGEATFILQGALTLSSSQAAGGTSVTATGPGLCASTAYNILFNYAITSGGNSYTYTTVGGFTTNSNGGGSGTFTVPNVGAGSYVVQLGRTGATGITPGTAVLSQPPTLTVGSVQSSSCNTTSCMTATGAPTQTTIGSNTAIQTSFTNTSNAPVTGIVYAVVHNSLGQTVSYSTATITAAAGSSTTAYDVLFGLAPGSYSVTVFVTSTSGTAISTTSTVSVTIG